LQKIIGTILVGIAIAAAAFYPFSPDQKEQSSGPVSSLKPGSYRAEYDQPDFRGWKAFLIMEVNTAGEINNIQYDYISTAGVLKTQDAAYNQRMKSKNGLGPSQYCPRFAKNLQIYQDPAKVDGITGATQSYKNFKDLAQAAFDAAKAGSRTVMLVPQPEANAPQAAGGKK
jgi:major membrane immunogen (membrane-anchored lipoprotein)